MTQAKKGSKAAKVEKTEMVKHDIFQIIQKNEDCKICLGNVQISTCTFKTIKEAIAYIDSKPYELLINTVCFAVYANQQTQNKK